jgi:insulysin
MGHFEYKLRFRRKTLRRLREEQISPPPVKEEEPPQTRFDDVKKSQQDAKNYRGLILSNGLKVFLVSDPNTTKCAACMCIEAGHMSDPVDVPGIAHLVEHTLFLGSQKYPNENHFRSFVSSNGGFTNAQTFADVTKYFFDIMPEKLSEALDIFAQMFISPLFNEESIAREINAVNSEHEKNLFSDDWRVRMVNKTLANPNHPFSKFSTGNLDTLLHKPRRLGIDIKKELVSFHENWYQSGNLMNLSVVGKQSLDALEEMVQNCFVKGIVNQNVVIPRWNDDVYTRDQIMTKTYIEPKMDVRTMTLSFATPDLFAFHHSSVSLELLSSFWEL